MLRAGGNRQDNAEAYIAVSGRLHYAGGGRLWIVDPTQDRMLEAPEEAGPILQLADRFRTLGEHRRALLEAGWQDDGSGSLDSLLTGLVRSGALVPRSELLRRILETPPEPPPAPIAAIAWITRERPMLLRRSIQSAIANLRLYGRRVELRIYDDSSDARARQDTRVMLAELGRQGYPVYYAGLEEKRSFAAALQARLDGVTAERIEFALFDPLGIGYAPGANTNAALLDNCGKLFLHADDDTVFRFASLPETKAGLRLSSAMDPTEVRFFAGPDLREAAVQLRDADILAAHESLLGRKVADCLRQQEGQADCDEVSPELLPLLLGGGGEVAATMAGACGDSGMGSPLFLLWLSGRSREEAMANRQSYQAALRGREILRAAPRATISPSPFFMAMHCGLDNRSALPPFLPVFRNADGVFGQLLRTGCPQHPVAHLPAAVAHLPGERRVFPGELRVQPRAADLLVLLLRSLAPASWLRDPEARFACLGQGLVQAGSLSPADFAALLRELWVGEMSRHLVVLERLLEEHHGEPEYWAADVEALQQQIRRQAAGQDPLAPVDLSAPFSGLQAASAAQRVTRAYGQLLLDWPLLWAASAALHASGASSLALPQ